MLYVAVEGERNRLCVKLDFDDYQKFKTEGMTQCQIEKKVQVIQNAFLSPKNQKVVDWYNQSDVWDVITIETHCYYHPEYVSCGHKKYVDAGVRRMLWISAKPQWRNMIEVMPPHKEGNKYYVESSVTASDGCKFYYVLDTTRSFYNWVYKLPIFVEYDPDKHAEDIFNCCLGYADSLMDAASIYWHAPFTFNKEKNLISFFVEESAKGMAIGRQGRVIKAMQKYLSDLSGEDIRIKIESL